MITRIPRNTSRIEVIAHRAEIEDLLSKGLSYMSIFKKLKAENKISCKYHAFLKAIRLICENKTNEKPHFSPQPVLVEQNKNSNNQTTNEKNKISSTSDNTTVNMSTRETLKLTADYNTLIADEQNNGKEGND